MTTHSPYKAIKILARKLTIRNTDGAITLTLQILTLKPLSPDTYEITDITPYAGEQPATVYISRPLEADTNSGKITIPIAIVLQSELREAETLPYERNENGYKSF